jgi:hypothetical protein
MTVAELILVLQGLPPQETVFVLDAEGEEDEAEKVEITRDNKMREHRTWI